jgi:hypothetical protein
MSIIGVIRSLSKSFPSTDRNLDCTGKPLAPVKRARLGKMYSNAEKEKKMYTECEKYRSDHTEV